MSSPATRAAARPIATAPAPASAATARHARWLALGAGGLAFAVYGLAGAPGLYWLDSGELTSAAFSLGTAHPAGYPLHTLLGKLVTFVPLGSVAFRLVLLSAALGAVAVGISAWLAARLSRALDLPPRLALVGGGTSAALVALTYPFFRQATVAEVYTLAAALATLSWLLLLRQLERPSPQTLLVLAFVAGLASLGGHPTYRVLVLPVLLAAWFWSATRYRPRSDRPLWRRLPFLGRRAPGGSTPTITPPSPAAPRRAPASLRAAPIALALGSLVVLHLVAAADRGRLPDWAHASTLSALWEHVMAQRIREATFAPLMFSLQAPVVRHYLEVAWQSILGPFVGIALPLALVGAISLLRRRGAGRVLAGALLFAAAGDFVYSFWVNPMGLRDLQNGITTVVALGVLAGVGLGVTAAWIGRHAPRFQVTVAAVLAGVAALPAGLDMATEKLRGAGYGAADWSDAALWEVPPQGAVFTQSDDLSAGLTYAQQVEGARPDVLLLVRQHLWVSKYLLAHLRRDDDPTLHRKDLAAWAARPRLVRQRDRLNVLARLIAALGRHRAVLWEPGDGADRSALHRPLRPGLPLFSTQSARRPARQPARRPAPSPRHLAPEPRRVGVQSKAHPWHTWVARLGRVLRDDPGLQAARIRSRALNALGMLALEQGHDPRTQRRAEALFALATRAWPTSVAARINRAVLLGLRAERAEKAGDKERARRLLRTAAHQTEVTLEQDPTRYVALLNAARFHLRLAQLSGPADAPSALRESDRARDLLLRARRLFPHRADPWFNLGVIAARLQRYARARDLFREALRRDPRHRAARIYQRQVRRILSGAGR